MNGLKRGDRVNTVDDGPGVVTTAKKNQYLVKLDSGDEYWEPADEVTLIPVGQRMATEKQIDYLYSLGYIGDASSLTLARASEKIDELKSYGVD